MSKIYKSKVNNLIFKGHCFAKDEDMELTDKEAKELIKNEHVYVSEKEDEPSNGDGKEDGDEKESND